MRCEPKDKSFSFATRPFSELVPSLAPDLRRQLEDYLRGILTGDHIGLAPASLRSHAAVLVPALSTAAHAEGPTDLRNAIIEAIGSLYSFPTVAILKSLALQELPEADRPRILSHGSGPEEVWFKGTAIAIKWLRARAMKGDLSADQALLDLAHQGNHYTRELAALAYRKNGDDAQRRSTLAATLPLTSSYVLNLQMVSP